MHFSKKMDCRVKPGNDGHWALLLPPAIALRDQLVEFVGLLGDAVRGPLFVLTAAGSGRLLDQLSKVVSQDSDAIVEFRER
jgi:hypothetical protein